MKVKEIFKFCYPLLNAHGITYALGEEGFLATLEAALHYIETYEGFLWKWQHYSEQIDHMDPVNGLYIRHQTKYPILHVDRFWGGDDTSIDEQLSFCDCPDPEIEPCGCNQGCISNCICLCLPLKMEEVLPHTKLCAGTYRVAAGDVQGMGGENGTVLHIVPYKKPRKMFVTYYRGFEPITDYNQEVYIPRHFINAIKYAIMMDVYVNKGAGGESLLTYFEEKFDKAMTSLKKTDTVMGNNFVRGQNDQQERYPFYGDQVSTVTNVY